MGCLKVNISRATDPLLPVIAKLGGLRATATRTREPLRAKVGMVCSISDAMAIRFAKDKLVWEGDTNTDGVVIYNTLVVTGEWKMEEIVIEELL